MFIRPGNYAPIEASSVQQTLTARIKNNSATQLASLWIYNEVCFLFIYVTYFNNTL